MKPALAVMALVLLFAAGAFLYTTQWRATPQRPAESPATVLSPWAEGIKHKEAGGVDITLTFLNREALGILALTEKVSDRDLAGKYYALLELKANEGCISEKFDSAVEGNVSFLTAGGPAVAATVPPALAGEGSSVYRAGACGGEPGVVSLRRYLSAERRYEINGMSISGLSEEAPLVTIR
jgi:hypothetical protein